MVLVSQKNATKDLLEHRLIQIKVRIRYFTQIELYVNISFDAFDKQESYKYLLTHPLVSHVCSSQC